MHAQELCHYLKERKRSINKTKQNKRLISWSETEKRRGLTKLQVGDSLIWLVLLTDIAAHIIRFLTTLQLVAFK